VTAEEYLLVKAKIKRELDNISILESELHRYGLFPKIISDSIGKFSLDDPAACRIIGSILHDYYVAVENIFKSVARRIDGSLLDGEYWHKELLEQMTLDIPGIRPPVITSKTFVFLNELRGFRHVFRHVYGFSLAPERIIDLLRTLSEFSSLLKNDLETFMKKEEEMFLKR
jgi:hypothetical protein